MHNHAPQNYDCPFCKVFRGIEDETFFTRQGDVFYRDEHLTAFISSHWWPNNPGHVIIIPNEHVENIYTLPDELSDCINRFAKHLAVVIKELYQCDGVSLRQHNEPAGGQDVWHYHVHVFPRFRNDGLYELDKQKKLAPASERSVFAHKLKTYFDRHRSPNPLGSHKIITGNLDERVAFHPETNAWFLGSFMQQYPEFLSDEVEMKWIRHRLGESKPGLSTKTSTKTFVILLEGSFLVRFTHPEQTVKLKHQGDFVFYDAGQTDHEALALDDCLLLVVRYPSKRKV